MYQVRTDLVCIVHIFEMVDLPSYDWFFRIDQPGSKIYEKQKLNQELV